MFDKNFRVLIVDDDLSFLDNMATMLEAIGVGEIFRADSGARAVEALCNLERPVDCILCNYGMPRGNGLQLLQSIRMSRLKTVRSDACFVLMTASRSPTVVKAAGQLDVSGYLVKPVTAKILEVAILKARRRCFPIDFKKYANVVIPEYEVGGLKHQPVAGRAAPKAPATQVPSGTPDKAPRPMLPASSRGGVMVAACQTMDT